MDEAATVTSRLWSRTQFPPCIKLITRFTVYCCRSKVECVNPGSLNSPATGLQNVLGGQGDATSEDKETFSDALSPHTRRPAIFTRLSPSSWLVKFFFHHVRSARLHSASKLPRDSTVPVLYRSVGPVTHLAVNTTITAICWLYSTFLTPHGFTDVKTALTRPSLR